MADFSRSNQNPQASSDDVMHYITQALLHQEQGQDSLALHLYLAAFECFPDRNTANLTQAELAQLRHSLDTAWDLALKLKEHTLAEYVFDRLRHFLPEDEITQHMAQLQDLALAKLEDAGFSAQELQDVTEMIAHELEQAGMMQPSFDAAFSSDQTTDSKTLFAQQSSQDSLADLERILRTEAQQVSSQGSAKDAYSLEVPSPGFESQLTQALNKSFEKHAQVKGMTKKPVVSKVRLIKKRPAEAAEDDASAHGNAKTETSSVQTPLPDASNDAKFTSGQTSTEAVYEADMARQSAGQLNRPDDKVASKQTQAGQAVQSTIPERLIGYIHARVELRNYGMGFEPGQYSDNLMAAIKKSYGFDYIPLTQALVFGGQDRGDVNHFVQALIEDLGLSVRTITTNEQGAIRASTFVSQVGKARGKRAHYLHPQARVWLLKDIDIWIPRLFDVIDQIDVDQTEQPRHAKMLASAFEILDMIKAAMESPIDVVFATVSSQADLDIPGLEMLYPCSFIEIEKPDVFERQELLAALLNSYPVLKSFDLVDLVRYTQGLSREDMMAAFKELILDSFAQSLALRHVAPITVEALFSKLALYHPVDSDHYRAMEDALAQEFYASLDNLASHIESDELYGNIT